MQTPLLFSQTPSLPAVLILAGGSSTRMGRDKALLELDGRTLLQRAIDFWKALLPESRIYVALGRRDHELSLSEGIFPIYDREPGQGPLGGLLAAFEETGENLFCVSAVDMPNLCREAFDILNQARGGADICVFRRRGRPEPLFGFYSRACLPMIRQVLSGSRRMIDVLEGCDTVLVEPREETWLANVNTPGDFASLSG